MKKSVPFVPFFLLSLILLILTACGETAQEAMAPSYDTAAVEVAVTRVVSEETTVMEEMEMDGEMAYGFADDVAAATAMPMPTASPASPDGRANQAPAAPRMIIKNGTLEVTVNDTETAVNILTTTIIDAGGYIVNQRIWEQDDYTYATLTVGVPVNDFERIMRSAGTLGDVTNEVATGQDVTDEFVDLESRLGNLLATQDRLRDFLDEAENVEEILAVNSELSKVEEELEVIQGRMTYLTDRASFSTINITLNPYIPPAPTRTPVVHTWAPSETALDAAEQLQDTAQDTADFFIYNIIARGPWLLLLGFIGTLIWRNIRRRRQPRMATPPAATAQDN